MHGAGGGLNVRSFYDFWSMSTATVVFLLLIMYLAQLYGTTLSKQELLKNFKLVNQLWNQPVGHISLIWHIYVASNEYG